ncbi:RAD51-associated protein 1 isoform X2 [Neoarius graeffei]|uniref:RAD51-associated protein 1 isoform X2 n=1 Tax=Neoarius graeffei TaxID=443677 RepID=UPI00298D532D|nr:RAD51-associated protein 1 isoform X2 [Neoarius graeffei]
MERPSRNKKAISYSDFLDDDDDEDFATAKAPPNKKARASVKECQQDKTQKNEIIDLTAKAHKERLSLDEKLYKRDLETALILSQLQSTETFQEPTSNGLDEKSEPCEDVPPMLTHFSVDSSCFDKPSSHPSPPVLSDCSVDVTCLGLDQITSEPSSAMCMKRKSQKATKQQRCVLEDVKENEEDEDYRLQNTPESDSEFSDMDESEDEEYTVKRKREKLKTAKSVKKTAPKAVKKEKKPMKPDKTKPQSKVKNTVLSSPEVRSPAAAQPLCALNRTPTSPPVTKSTLHTSPAGGRMPKWTPPGLVGRSPSSCQSPPVKSPGLGLRLGLSRLARVKPLHPNTVAH